MGEGIKATEVDLGCTLEEICEGKRSQAVIGAQATKNLEGTQGRHEGQGAGEGPTGCQKGR